MKTIFLLIFLVRFRLLKWPGGHHGVVLGKTHPIQVQLDGLLDDGLGLKVIVSRVFTVAVQINSQGIAFFREDPCFSINQSMSLRAMLILPGIGGK